MLQLLQLLWFLGLRLLDLVLVLQRHLHQRLLRGNMVKLGLGERNSWAWLRLGLLSRAAAAGTRAPGDGVQCWVDRPPSPIRHEGATSIRLVLGSAKALEVLARTEILASLTHGRKRTKRPE